MVDMAKVHGLETAQEIVRKIWHEKVDGLRVYSDKSRELLKESFEARTDRERQINRDERYDNNDKWSYALGEVGICSKILDALAEVIRDEMNVDSEVLA